MSGKANKRRRRAGGAQGQVYYVGERGLRPREARALIRKRDGAACWVCGREVVEGLAQGDPEQATVDHVVAWAEGGSGELGNLRLAHERCNAARGHETAKRVSAVRSGPALSRLLDLVGNLVEHGEAGPHLSRSSGPAPAVTGPEDEP